MKADEIWNNWFTVNHVNNVNSILAEEINGPIRGRKCIKLRRDDPRSKIANTNDSFKTRDKQQINDYHKMGQLHSTDTHKKIQFLVNSNQKFLLRTKLVKTYLLPIIKMTKPYRKSLI